MFVIGTAGHVDHGKSSLVQALTGIDPDRLAEEKARQMTIDLGFAWLKLSDLEEVGVVDVPGHLDFIENMLAGVGGIDLALLVIAADEGIMPQTREHLAILDLLEVRTGVVALSKVDLIDDPDWLELVTLDVAEALSGTILADAPIVPVSARTGAGLVALKKVLTEKLAATAARTDMGRPRLPIDRVFTLAGFGTVVTGTLVDGRLHMGDSVEIQPSGLNGRIRGLQTHKTKLDTARPGSRVAVNLTGIDREQIKRGDVLTLPNVLNPTVLVDGMYRHLTTADAPLRHNMEVKLFVGSAETIATVRVIGATQIEPGQRGWVQLTLHAPLALSRGDRFILRRPSPSSTLGGGQILEPHPGQRHRRFREGVVQQLQTMAQGTPSERLLQALSKIEPTSAGQLFKQAGLDAESGEALLQGLIASGQIVDLQSQLLVRDSWQKQVDRLTAVLQEYHQTYPLRVGMPREALRSRLKLPANLFEALLLSAPDQFAREGTFICRVGYKVTLTPAQQTAVQSLLNQFKLAGIASPSIKECKAAIGDELYYALVESGQLRPLNSEVVYAQAEYEQFTGAIKAFLQANGRINAAEARDLLQTSRKYAIALLEHLDETKVTRRIEDTRELL